MRNGEGSGKKLSIEVASTSHVYDSVDHHDGNEMDGRDDDDVCCSSQYSSCGESDFDKYCSANSAMGTPSVCGSVGSVFHDFNNDSDFGSLKSFKLGDDNCNPRPFRMNRRLSNYRRSEFCDGETRSNVGLGEGSVEGSLRNEDFLANLYVGEEWRGEDEMGMIGKFCGNDFNEENIVDGSVSEAVGVEEGGECHRSTEPVSGGLEGLEVLSDLEYEGGEVDNCSNEGENSSRYEHSEGEDSMFGNGTDDDRRVDVYHRKTIQRSEEGAHGNRNTLVMTSATAFGSEDWDDFMQENGDNPLGSELFGVMKSSFGTIASDSTLDLVANGKKELNIQNEVRTTNHVISPPLLPSIKISEKHKDSINVSAPTNQIPHVSGLEECSGLDSIVRLDKFGEAKGSEDLKGVPLRSKNNVGINVLADDIQTSSRSNLSKLDQDPLLEKAHLKENIRDSEPEKKQEATGAPKGAVIKSEELKEKIDFLLDPLSDSAVKRPYLISGEVTENSKAQFLKDRDSNELSSLDNNNLDTALQTSPIVYKRFEDYFTPGKTDTSELNEFFDEFVHDMEEVLLDSSESPGSRLTQKSRLHHPNAPVPLRDGSSSASTSGAIDAYPLIQHHLKIDGVEVVGAKQKKGDVSLSERLVGVKEYTVYVIRVWSGDDHWEVERRYRDFCTLYRHLKKVFADQGWILPSPWSSVEQESRKIFGSSSPGVIAERSELIQQCLTSVLSSRNLSSSSNALISFLSPSNATPISSASDMHMEQNSVTESTWSNNSSSLGRTISFVVKIQPHKSTKQLLDAQHYTCSGCRRNFNDGKTRLQDLVQTFGWGKPRLCEYSGQLFCSLCHTNDTAVLPARVLHYWDFAKYPVSQLAKSYLDSIYDQPMVCVGAVNPHLFSKVPALQHVTNIRKRIRAMLPYVRCPFRTSINKALGSRRYLLESSDFFALRDLVDLSKGVFAALPVMMETVSKRILEHITEQCLICCDVGIPCNARQVCYDPSSLIFPFQEGEIEKCKSCSLAFHKNCFKKVVSCPCGARLKPEAAEDSPTRRTLGTSTLSFLSMDSIPSTSLFSGLLSKVMPQVTRNLGEQAPTDNSNVILMGSLPNTSL